MSKIANLFIFIAGAAIGSVITYKLTVQKYDHLVQEEIASVKAAFSDKEKTTRTAENRRTRRKADINGYADEITKNGYVNYSDRSKKDVKDTMIKNMDDIPYTISPDEYGELSDYEQISLTYYADGVLADDSDEVVEDIEETVGRDSLSHFGEYENDAVFVRNDRLKADYEILRDERTYASVVGYNVYGSGLEDE